MRRIISAYLEGNVDEASAIHRGILPLLNTLMTTMVNPIPIKYALRQLGFPTGDFRLPLVDPNEASGRHIMDEIAKHKIDFVPGKHGVAV